MPREDELTYQLSQQYQLCIGCLVTNQLANSTYQRRMLPGRHSIISIIYYYSKYRYYTDTREYRIYTQVLLIQVGINCQESDYSKGIRLRRQASLTVWLTPLGGGVATTDLCQLATSAQLVDTLTWEPLQLRVNRQGKIINSN